MRFWELKHKAHQIVDKANLEISVKEFSTLTNTAMDYRRDMAELYRFEV